MKAPYGTWTSPITAESITGTSSRGADVLVDEADGTVYHLEARPSEGGRTVLIDTLSGKDVVDKDVNIGTGVHEYGGGAAKVHKGILYYSNRADGRVYRGKIGKSAEPVTPQNQAHRFADFDIHPTHEELLVSVLEDHTIDKPLEVVNTLCIVNTNTKIVSPLVSGTDFYASPKFSPDGTHIVWQQWSLADMPWEGAEIHVADVIVDSFGAVTLQNDVHVAGETVEVSAGFPSWISNTVLLFTSDKSGYQNPWKYTLGQKAAPVLKEPLNEDFSDPAWQLGWSFYAPVDEDGQHVIFTAMRDGRKVLYLINIEDGTTYPVDNPYTFVMNIRTISRSEHSAVFIGMKIDESMSIVKFSVSFSLTGPSFQFTTLKASAAIQKTAHISKDIISAPRPLSRKLAPDNRVVHATFYPPHNPEYSGSTVDSEKPPCVVCVHGGPTAYTGQEVNWTTQYFTSRGWAWLDVNYEGSSGFGRAYIERLAGKWGVLDAIDVVDFAQVISQGPDALVDPKRLVVRGSSSGGFVALAVLTTVPDVSFFAAAASLYGISDLVGLVEHTHKFEANYGTKLMGGTYEDVPEVYKERSPINSAGRIVSPLLILQGDIDRVVPKEQAQAIYDNIMERGGTVEFKLYEGEGHGWRKESTIIDALESEIRFYEKILKLQ